MDISKLTTNKKLQLARNPNTPVGVLAELAKDDYWRVRYDVAWNPTTPVGALMVLAQDDSDGVRRGVAWNVNSTVEALATLLQLELRGKLRKNTLDFIFNHKNSTDTIKAIIKTVFLGVQ